MRNLALSLWRRLPTPIRLPLRHLISASLRTAHHRGLPLRIGERRLRVAFGNLDHYREIKHFHDYEPEFLDEFMAQSREANVVFDVGANMGLYALTAAASNPSSRVLAFEPEPALCDLIERSSSMNRISTIEVKRMALGDTTGTLELCISGGTGHFVVRPDDEAQTVTVAARTIDELIETGEVPTPDMVKIDVEGFEASVLRGMSRLLSDGHARVLVEIHGKFLKHYGESAEGVDEFMAELGYDKRVLRRPGVGKPTQHQQTHVLFTPSTGAPA